jgi:hypothetical protein
MKKGKIIQSNIGQPDVQVDEAFLQSISDKPEEFQASLLDARARRIEKFNKRVYHELGLIALYMEEKSLWRKCTLDDGSTPKSFEGWVKDACPYSRSYLFDAKRTVKILRGSGAEMKQIEDIPRCNAITLSKLSPALIRNPEIIDAAKHLPEEEFTKKIADSHPEQHIEERRKLIFHLEVSAKVTVDSAIEQAMKVFDCGRDEALERICETVLEVFAKEEAKAATANA